VIVKAVSSAKLAFVENKLSNSIKYLQSLVPICQLAYDMQNLLWINQIIAKSYFIKKNYAECIPYCTRIICVIESYDYEKAFKIQCEALRMKANCEMALKNHKEAITTLKFLLESSFRGKN